MVAVGYLLYNRAFNMHDSYDSQIHKDYVKSKHENFYKYFHKQQTHWCHYSSVINKLSFINIKSIYFI